MIGTYATSQALALRKTRLQAAWSTTPTRKWMRIGVGDSNQLFGGVGLIKGMIRSLAARGIPNWTSGLRGLLINGGNGLGGLNIGASMTSITVAEYRRVFDDAEEWPANFADIALRLSGQLGVSHLRGYGLKASDDGYTYTLPGVNGVLTVANDESIYDVSERMIHRVWGRGPLSSLMRRSGALSTVGSDLTNQTSLIASNGPGLHYIENELAAADRSAWNGVACFPYATTQGAPYYVLGHELYFPDRNGVAVTQFLQEGGRSLVELNGTLFNEFGDAYLDYILGAYCDMLGPDGTADFVIPTGVNDFNDTLGNEGGDTGKHLAWDPINLGQRLSGVYSNTKAGFKANCLTFRNKIAERWAVNGFSPALFFTFETTHRQDDDGTGTQSTLEQYAEAHREIADEYPDVIVRNPSDLFTATEMEDLWDPDGAGFGTAHLDETDDSYEVFATAVDDDTLNDIESYTEGAMSGFWTPHDSTEGDRVFFVEANDVTSISHAGGTVASVTDTWNDHEFVSDGAAAPSTGAETINGLNVISTGGGTSRLRATGMNVPLGRTIHVFHVGTRASTSDAIAALSTATNDPTVRLVFTQNTHARRASGAAVAFTQDSARAVLADTAHVIHDVYHNVANAAGVIFERYVNGSATPRFQVSALNGPTAAFTTEAATDACLLDDDNTGNAALNSKLLSVIVVAGDIGDDEQRYEGYLADLAGVTLEAGHPYAGGPPRLGADGDIRDHLRDGGERNRVA